MLNALSKNASYWTYFGKVSEIIKSQHTVKLCQMLSLELEGNQKTADQWRELYLSYFKEYIKEMDTKPEGVIIYKGRKPAIEFTLKNDNAHSRGNL